MQVKAITRKLLAYKDANLLFDLLKIFSICIIGGLEGKQHTSFFGRFTQQNHFRFLFPSAKTHNTYISDFTTSRFTCFKYWTFFTTDSRIEKGYLQ